MACALSRKLSLRALSGLLVPRSVRMAWAATSCACALAESPAERYSFASAACARHKAHLTLSGQSTVEKALQLRRLSFTCDECGLWHHPFSIRAAVLQTRRGR